MSEVGSGSPRKNWNNEQLNLLLLRQGAAYVLYIQRADRAPLLSSVAIEEDECRGHAKVEMVTQFLPDWFVNV